MAQGMLGAATSYGDQSINEILADINKWVFFTEETKCSMESKITLLRDNNYWSNMPYNFRGTISDSLRCQETFIEDFSLIVSAIKERQLTKKEVTLMDKIGRNAIDYNRLYGSTYNEESLWKKHGDKNFRVAEQLYAEGRDYFVTIQDACNVSARLEDYIDTIAPVMNQSVNQVVNGNRNIITGFNSGTINNSELNISNIASEIDEVLEKLEELKDLDSTQKEYIEDLLNDAKIATIDGDLEGKDESISKMKSFLVGAGSKGVPLLNLLGNYSSIASYFQL